MTETIDAILDFWFGDLDERGLCSPAHQSMWFKPSASNDQYCGEQFGNWVSRGIAGDLDQWADSDRGLVALVLLLDQFTRNIYRGTAQAFAGDARSLGLVQQAIVAGRHLNLPSIHQVFLYLPMEHSEDMAVQEHCVQLFTDLAATTGLQAFADFLRYAQAHQDVIGRFGRFPHRNAILNRDSTPQELEYLTTHGGF